MFFFILNLCSDLVPLSLLLRIEGIRIEGPFAYNFCSSLLDEEDEQNEEVHLQGGVFMHRRINLDTEQEEDTLVRLLIEWIEYHNQYSFLRKLEDQKKENIL